MHVKILAVVALGVFAIAFQVPTQATEIPISGTTVTGLTPERDGKFYIWVAGTSTCSSGSSPKRYYVTVGQNSITQDGAKNLYAIALAAISLNRPVTLYFDNGTTSCYITRILLEDQ